uniref:Uncharacterized protein n=1 Tax=Rhizophora mucronata TaxID=61149 RepID=A0A2P2P0P1_RHIMU
MLSHSSMLQIIIIDHLRYIVII